MPNIIHGGGTAGGWSESYVIDFVERTANKVFLPKEIKNIGSYAFSNFISLTQIDMPENVISIGDFPSFLQHFIATLLE